MIRPSPEDYRDALLNLRQFRERYVARPRALISLGSLVDRLSGNTPSVTLSDVARDQILAALDLEEAALLARLKTLEAKL